jgi:hypothetical protein
MLRLVRLAALLVRPAQLRVPGPLVLPAQLCAGAGPFCSFSTPRAEVLVCAVCVMAECCMVGAAGARAKPVSKPCLCCIQHSAAPQGLLLAVHPGLWVIGLCGACPSLCVCSWHRACLRLLCMCVPCVCVCYVVLGIEKLMKTRRAVPHSHASRRPSCIFLCSCRVHSRFDSCRHYCAQLPSAFRTSLHAAAECSTIWQLPPSLRAAAECMANWQLLASLHACACDHACACFCVAVLKLCVRAAACLLLCCCTHSTAGQPRQACACVSA